MTACLFVFNISQETCILIQYSLPLMNTNTVSTQVTRTAHPTSAMAMADVFIHPAKKQTPTFGAAGKHIFGASNSITAGQKAVLPPPPEDLPKELHEDWNESQAILQKFRYPSARLELQELLTMPEHTNRLDYAFIKKALQDYNPKLHTHGAQIARQSITDKIAESKQIDA